MPSNRKFGLFFSFIFCCLSSYLFINDTFLYSSLTLLLSAVLFLVAFIKPQLLSLFNKIWFKFGIILSKISAPIFLSSIYFLLITPVAIFTRHLGRDELRLKRHVKSTYWHDVKHINRSNTDFKLQS